MARPKHGKSSLKLERGTLQYKARCYCGFTKTDPSLLRAGKALDYHIIAFRPGHTTDDLYEILNKTEADYR